jgi:hypothetical protein
MTPLRVARGGGQPRLEDVTAGLIACPWWVIVAELPASAIALDGGE